MSFLAICTVGRATLIVAKTGDQVFCEELEFSRHSENLFPLLIKMLSSHDLGLEDFDCFGCVVGPGSFTGIRIGMSVIKAFGYALKKPVVAINSLELLASNAVNNPQPGTVLAVINAGAGMVYHQAFERVAGELRSVYQPRKDTFEHFEAYFDASLKGKCEVVYSQNDEKGRDFTEFFGENSTFLCDSLARAIGTRVDQKAWLSSEEVVPLYLRGSSAEQNILDADFVRLGVDDIAEIELLESQRDEFDLPWSRRATLDSLNNPNFECYGLKNKAGVWGMISILKNDDECEIVRVIVRRQARELGLGRRMLQQIVQMQRDAKRSAIFLEVNEHNFPALALYQSCGFERVGERKKYYDGRDSAILMKLTLN